jgi:hypothetical protein
MRNIILAGMAAAIAGTATGLLMLDRPAVAQVFSTGTTVVSAATAGNGATDMWAIDPRTNQVIYCRGSGGAPVCKAVLLPGAAQPIDKLPR